MPMAARSKGQVCGRLLAGISGSNLASTWASVSFELCVLSGRGLCDGPISPLWESYRVWCIQLSVARWNSNPRSQARYMIWILTGAFLGYKLDTVCLSGCINKRPVHPSTALTFWARLINNKRLRPRCFRTDVPRIELRWRLHCTCLPAWPRFPPASLLQNGFSSGSGRPEHDVDHLSPSSADLRMGGVIPSTSLSIWMGTSWGDLYLYLSNTVHIWDLFSWCAQNRQHVKLYHTVVAAHHVAVFVCIVV
jgi:hypothetical protein